MQPDPRDVQRADAAKRRKNRDVGGAIVSPIICMAILLSDVAGGWDWSSIALAAIGLAVLFLFGRICWGRGYSHAMDDAKQVLHETLTESQLAELARVIESL